MRSRASVAAAVSAVLALAPGFVAQDGKTPKSRVTIEPSAIVVAHPGDTARVLVLATTPDGLTVDVTGEAQLRSTGTASLRIGERGRFLAETAGEATLHASFDGTTVAATVVVRDLPAPPPDFRSDVLPILTRQGCNSGGCHGAALGKNGFRLSLFGFDPESDHQRITRELRGRRIDQVEVDESLLLGKPSLGIPHRGGKRLDEDDPFYATVRAWIERGAPAPAEKQATPRALRVLPGQAVLSAGGAHLDPIVVAEMDDGTTRDVTSLALLSSTDEGTASVARSGRVSPLAPGVAHVLARFGTLATVAEVVVVDATRPVPAEPEAGASPFDREIEAGLRRRRLSFAPAADDATFLRRAYLDIVGLLPPAEGVRPFLHDSSPDKRARLVDELLDRPEFADVWALAFAEVLKIDSQKLREKGMHHYSEYLKSAFRARRPFDQVVYELLTASGPAFSMPATNFWLVESDPKVVAETTAQVFLGIRLQCAQCHNHPFERWTMDDYYGFAAFFAQVGRKTGDDPRERIVFDSGNGEVRHPKGDRVVAPRYLGGAVAEPGQGETRRELLARWLTARDNPFFARHVANRLFARFFGRGLVEPEDDVRVSNPPSHPGLLDALAARLVATGFDFRAVVREICLSRTWQQAAGDPALPAAAFSGARLRRLSAEQMIEAIDAVTGDKTRFAGLDEAARAVEVEDSDPENAFLDIFGRPRRQTNLVCERQSDATLGQSLHLINGPTLQAKLRNESGWLRRRVKEGARDEDLIDELWLAAYARPPSPAEMRSALETIAPGRERLAHLEDLVWAVVNSKEFLFNH